MGAHLVPAEGAQPAEERRLAPIGVGLPERLDKSGLGDLFGQELVVLDARQGEAVEAVVMPLEELLEGLGFASQESPDQGPIFTEALRLLPTRLSHHGVGGPRVMNPSKKVSSSKSQRPRRITRVPARRSWSASPDSEKAAAKKPIPRTRPPATKPTRRNAERPRPIPVRSGERMT